MIFRYLLVFPIFAVDLQNAISQQNVIDMQKRRSIANATDTPVNICRTYLQDLIRISKLDLSERFDYVDKCK